MPRYELLTADVRDKDIGLDHSGRPYSSGATNWAGLGQIQFQSEAVVPLTRVTQTGGGLTRTTTTVFDDSARTVTTIASDTATQSLTTKTTLDPLGRIASTEDPAGNKVQKAYRYGTSGNSYQLTSNAYKNTSESTMGWTLVIRTVPTPSNSPLQTTATTYGGLNMPSPWATGGSANSAPTGTTMAALAISPCSGAGNTATDEANQSTTRCVDGLGRLSQVIEADGTTTNYTYDDRSNLVGVASGGQYRAFEYDSLDRVTKACNSETGSADCSNPYSLPTTGLERYTYDSNGNVLTRKDARGITTTFSSYDGLNRPAGKLYSSGGTSDVSYTYDQSGKKGVLSKVSTIIGTAEYSTSYGYDVLLRVNASTQVAGNSSYPFGYGYSLTDRLAQITYPSGRVVKYPADSYGRITGVQNGTSLAYYASVDYTPATGVPTVTLGNGIIETSTLNDRSQLTGLTAGKIGTASVLSLGFYPCDLQQTSCSSGNNGVLRSQAIGAPLNVSQIYVYDSAGRLRNAQEKSGTTVGWNEPYGYVNGSRWIEEPARTGLPTLTSETPKAATWFNSRNQVTGWTYDASGNLLGVPGISSFGFDSEGQQTSATVNGTTASYVYDGMGRRVQKTVGSVVTTYVYDAFGNLAAEYGGSGGGNPCGATCYVTVDHLGSTRMVTDGSGNVVSRYDYHPFGGELLAGINNRTTAMGYLAQTDAFNPKFTGQIRDSESCLDYFNARYYSPLQGRFTSPDPANAGADPANPQTWNMYAYVNNSPTNYTDPSGKGILSWLGTIIGGFLGGPIGAIAGWGAGTAGEAVLWGPGTNMMNGIPTIGSLAGCGGPLGNCGSLARGPWDEHPAVDHVTDPGGLILDYNSYQHFRMTLDAGGSLTFAIDVLGVDFWHGSQRIDPAHAHWHAMGGATGGANQLGISKGETCSAAYRGAVRQLSKETQKALSGDQAAAALAIHEIQDSYATGHLYQFWPGGIPSLSHEKGDAGYSSAAVDATRRYLQALRGAAPMRNPEDYLAARPAGCR